MRGNVYFKSFMPDLSAKVYRTHTAFVTLERAPNRLMEERAQVKDEETSLDVYIADIVKLYNEANRVLAILCNHQRAPPEQHKTSIATLRGK